MRRKASPVNRKSMVKAISARHAVSAVSEQLALQSWLLLDLSLFTKVYLLRVPQPACALTASPQLCVGT